MPVVRGYMYIARQGSKLAGTQGKYLWWLPHFSDNHSVYISLSIESINFEFVDLYEVTRLQLGNLFSYNLFIFGRSVIGIEYISEFW